MAITGDVGAGKSKAAEFFEALGGFRIDADRITAELWKTSEVITMAAGRWGRENILDASGNVSHRAVAGIIFENPEEYVWLTKFLHPLVKDEIERRIGLLSGERWVVAEIPLLFEAGVPSWVTVKVFVTARREIRLERCRSRGWDEAEMTKRERFFIPDKERMALSDYTVRNDGGLESLKENVETVHRKIFHVFHESVSGMRRSGSCI